MFKSEIVFRSVGTGQVLVIVLGLIALVLVFIAHHWRKSLWSFLSLLCKVSALATLTFLLLRPELKKELQSSREPTLLVLKDGSPSMETNDLMDDDALISRTLGSERFFSSEQWQAFSDQTTMKVLERSFASRDRKTDLSAALKQAQALNPTAILIASDGSWNSGEPPSRVGQEYSLSGTSIFSLGLGSPKRMPDLELEVLESPVMVEAEESFVLRLEARSSFAERVKTRLIVRYEEKVLEDQELVIEPEGKQVIDIVHEFANDGIHDIQMELTAIDGEVLTENNYQKTKITARKQFMKVLLVDTLPRWEYRFIRNAMIRDERVKVDCLLLHPGMAPGAGPNYIQNFPESLAPYDVIFLGDIGVATGQLKEEEAMKVLEAVRTRATGLILMPGRKGWQQSLVTHPQFQELYPVEFSEELSGKSHSVTDTLRLSDAGEESLLMNLTSDLDKNADLWESLPGFNWYQPTGRLKAGATVLAYHDKAQNATGAMPLVVTSRVGRGKVLYMGIDSSWKWRRGVEDRYHYRFWRQMARWMSYQRNLTEGQQVQLFLSSESSQVGQEVRMNLIAMTSDGKPAKPSQIKLMITQPDNTQLISPLSKRKVWGEYATRFSPKQEGLHKVEVLIDNQSVASRTVDVAPEEFETIGEPADLDSLWELAFLTGALSVTYADRYDLIPQLEMAATPPPRFEFLPLAQQWYWIALLIVLLIASWIFRRLSGAE